MDDSDYQIRTSKHFILTWMRKLIFIKDEGYKEIFIITGAEGK